MLFFFSLFGCGDGNEDNSTGIHELDDENSLPICDAGHSGELYLAHSGESFYCNGKGSWQTLKGSSADSVRKDTLVVFQKDTLILSHVDTLLLSQKDTLLFFQKDTLVIRDTVIGLDGKSCSAEAIENGYKILCGNDSVGVVLNGKDGKNCKFFDDGHGAVFFECEKDTVTLYKALCDREPYDLHKSFCYNDGKKDSVVTLCGGNIYDLAKDFCYSKGGKDSVVSLCGGEKYDLDTAFCHESSLYACGQKPYNPTLSFCYNDGKKDSIVTLCGGNIYDLAMDFCYSKGGKDSIVSLCGGEKYDLDTAFCHESSLYACGQKPYNPTLSFCYNDGKKDSIVTLCGGNIYDLAMDFCYSKSGKDTLVTLCGGEKYDLDTALCHQEAIYSCGKKPYNPTADFCYSKGGKDTLVSLCGGEKYDLDTALCHEASLYSCGHKPYNPTLSFCYHFKDRNKDTIVTLCGGNRYDAASKLCDMRDARIYPIVTIGTQTWMAKNLIFTPPNYPQGSTRRYASGTFIIYKNNAYYNWATAMDSIGIYSNSAVGCGGTVKRCTPQYPVRGICPEGWHLPDTTEWNTLNNYMSAQYPDEGVGISLRSTSGWKKNQNGNDRIGFNAQPVGYYDWLYDPDDDEDWTPLEDSSSHAHFWSSNYQKNGTISSYYIQYNKKDLIKGHQDHNTNRIAIRCIKDD